MSAVRRDASGGIVSDATRAHDGDAAAAPQAVGAVMTPFVPYVQFDLLARHLLPLLHPRRIITLRNNSLVIKFGPGRRLLFASQDGENGQKNADWLDYRLKCVWTGSSPSSATFYPWKHDMLNHFWVSDWCHRRHVSPPPAPVWSTRLEDHGTLVEVLRHFKKLPSHFSEASYYFMSVGTKHEDNAILHYLKHYVRDGFAVEECLRTYPYTPGNDRDKQGGSPDLLLALRDAEGDWKFVSGEVKCTASCQNSACKARRTKLAKAMRALAQSDPQFQERMGLYAAAKELGASTASVLRDIKQQVRRRCNARSKSVVGFEPTDRLASDLTHVLECKKLDWVVYCTHDQHKTPHEDCHAYYVVQMQLEMFHQCTAEARMICMGLANGGTMNAYGMRFSMPCLAAGAVYMQTERELADYVTQVAGGDLRDENRQRALLGVLQHDPQYHQLCRRLHQNYELMDRWSWRASLGASVKLNTDYWCPFAKQWDALDSPSRDVLANAWVEQPKHMFASPAKRRRRQQPADQYEIIRQAWSPMENRAHLVRKLDFRRPDPKWLRPLTLAELQTQYTQFCEQRAAKVRTPTRLLGLATPGAHVAASEFDPPAPPPLSVVAPLLAPQGWVTEPFVLSERDVRYMFSVPAWGGTPDFHKPRWECTPTPLDDADELQFHQLFPHPTPWKFKRMLYRGSKTLAPLALGTCDAHGNLFPNYFGEHPPTLGPRAADTDDEQDEADDEQEEGEEEEWMDVEDLRAGMRVRFVVQSLGAYKEHVWVNISRILVEEPDDSDDSDNATTVPLT